MRKTNKEKGSVLLVLLVVSMVIVILGGTLSTAIAYSTKGNALNKVSEDLVLAAESGLEIAISKINANILNMPSTGSYTYKIDEQIFKAYAGIDVDVEIKSQGDRYRLVSTAIKDENKKSVAANISNNSIFVPGDTSVYRYTLCGKNIDVKANGSLNTYVTRWNAEDKSNSSVIGLGEQVSMNMESKSIITPKFIDGFEKATTVVEINNINDLKNRVGVRHIPSTEVSGVPIDVYLINSDEVYIGNIGAINATIIITNGIITMNSENNGNLGLSLNSSLLFGKGFKMTMPSFHCTYTLLDNSEPVMDILNSQEEIDKLDKAIRKYCTNWNSSAGGTIIDDSYEISDMEYID